MKVYTLPAKQSFNLLFRSLRNPSFAELSASFALSVSDELFEAAWSRFSDSLSLPEVIEDEELRSRIVVCFGHYVRLFDEYNMIVKII